MRESREHLFNVHPSRVHLPRVHQPCGFRAALMAGAALAVIIVISVFSAPASAAVDFEALRKDAPDVVAWINIPGTMVNYPVVQGQNNRFYLTHLPDGSSSASGAIFMDFRSSPDFTDQNTIIHGHRMNSGTMFGALKNYAIQEYYDRHPIVLLFTPQGDYKVHLFAGYAFDQNEETFPMRFQGDEDFLGFVQSVRERSMFESDVEVNAGDLLVTLLTCDTAYDDGRLMLIGKQLK